MKRHSTILISVLALVMGLAGIAWADPGEHADIVGQGPGGPVVAQDGARIHRTANGVTASISMSTPAPGSYLYPESSMWPTSSGEEGSPEAFSLWVFLFFNPEACDGGCDGSDLVGNKAVVAGAFNAGGHLVAGPNLTISGKINSRSAVFGGPMAETLSEALGMGYDVAGAEVHLAVAPHGALDPALLPGQITTPAGNPNYWWIALFD